MHVRNIYSARENTKVFSQMNKLKILLLERYTNWNSKIIKIIFLKEEKYKT